MTRTATIPPDAVLRASLAQANREIRDETIEGVADAIDNAISQAEASLIDLTSLRDRADVADVLIALQTARDAAERMKGRL